MNKILPHIQLLRLAQWTKNICILFPLFFSGQLFFNSNFSNALIGIIIFCLVSSSIYCLNDIMDRYVDAQHPTNKNRPIAAGIIHTSTAITWMVICLLLSIFLLYFFQHHIHFIDMITTLLIYISMNIAYTIFLKKIPIIDVFIIALGFVCRIIFGGLVGDVALSQWIVIMTFLLALFLAFAKRRDDVFLFENTGIHHRANTIYYNLSFLHQILSVLATSIIVAYLMYTLSHEVQLRFGTKYVYITAIFVIAGLIRYLQLTIVESRSGNPSKLLYKDRFILTCVLLWLCSFFIIIYV